MTTKIFDPVELAAAIARVAAQTQEQATARLLLTLAEQLLTDAGLPELPDRRQTNDGRSSGQ